MGVPGEVLDPTAVVGEMIEFASGDTRISGYLARPSPSEEPRPGVIVIHEAWGLVEHIKDICRRLANVGFDALAPDLYSRAPIPDLEDRDAVFATMFGLSDDQAVQDLAAGIDHLRSLDGSNGKVGTVGFCSGGRHVLLLATSDADLDVAIDCWGGFIDKATRDKETTPSRPVPVMQRARQLSCPILVVGGANDENPSPGTLDSLVQDLRRANQPVEHKIYPDVGHAFFADYRPTYQPEAAAELWNDMVRFLGAHLRDTD